MSRQCPSCGGICKRSGCERANVEVKSAAGEEPVGYWQGKFSLDGGATLYEVPQVSAFGRSYPNIPLWEHPAPAAEQDRIDAECFRFWVREAASNPVGMAQLISKCITEQEYRDAIIPCVEKAKAVIATAKGAGL